MVETLLTALLLAAAIIVPTVMMAWLAGRFGRAGALWPMALLCGLVVPGAMLLYVFSQMHRAGYGDAMGLGLILIFAGLVTPITVLTAFLTLRRMRRGKATGE